MTPPNVRVYDGISEGFTGSPAKTKGRWISMANPTLAPVDLSDIPEVQREGKASRIVEEFLDSNLDAAQVTDGSKNFGSSLKRYIKMNDAPVEVVGRKTGTYLKRISPEAVAERRAKWDAKAAENDSE